jgi:muconolactone delta-isomerase
MAKAASDVVDTGAEPALSVLYNIVLDDQKTLALQTYLPVSCKPKELNELLDRMSAAADRQAAQGKIVKLKRSLAMQAKQLRRTTEDLNAIDGRFEAMWKKAGKKGEFRLTTEQEAQKRNAHTTQARFGEEISEIKQEIADLEALLKG